MSNSRQLAAIMFRDKVGQAALDAVNCAIVDFDGKLRIGNPFR